MAQKSNKTHVEFDCDGKHYKLEMTANSLKTAEKKGVNFRTLTDAPLSARQTIFWIACFANHPDVSLRKARQMYEALALTAENMDAEYDDDGEEVNALDEVLLTMLNEAFEELNAKKGNVSWSVT